MARDGLRTGHHGVRVRRACLPFGAARGYSYFLVVCMQTSPEYVHEGYVTATTDWHTTTRVYIQSP